MLILILILILIGSKIHLLSNKDGLFGREGTIDNFECSLKDIPDALAYQGLVILKLPQDPPKTEDSIIFGLSKFDSARGKKSKTADAIDIAEVGLILSKIIESQSPDHSKQVKVEKSIKPLSFYRHIADKAWYIYLNIINTIITYLNI